MRKIWCFSFLVILCSLPLLRAAEGKCSIDADFAVTEYTYEPEWVIGPDGKKHIDPLLGPDGKPLLDENGKPKYKLKSPLTINFLIEGSYTITHANRQKDGPHENVKTRCSTDVNGISPPENVSQYATERIGEQVIELLKKDLLKASCKKNKCYSSIEN